MGTRVGLLFSPKQGCADVEDVDLQHTAAREAEEEGRMAVGSVNFIRELLLDPKACVLIFEGSFTLFG